MVEYSQLGYVQHYKMNRLLVGMLGYASKPALLSGEILVILAQQVGVGREEGGGFLWLFGWLGWQKLLYGCFYFKKTAELCLVTGHVRLAMNTGKG